MITAKKATDYWFKIEPYVHVSIKNNCILLYNTLDGVFIESDKIQVIELLKETLQEDTCGVVLVTSERYNQKDIHHFIGELRKKYMGDIIDVTLSKGKPVQLLPFFNSPDIHELFKKHNFLSGKKVLGYLSQISIYVDHNTQIRNLIPFLQSLPGNLTYNIIGNLEDVTNYNELLFFLNQLPSSKKIMCPYTDIISLPATFENDFSYILLVPFPIDMQQWNYSRQLLFNQTLSFEYVFEISSLGDCQQATKLVEQFGIEKYQLKPVYAGNNIDFFEENIFLTKEDILSTPMSIKDFFVNQSMNIYNFGKINIMPDGDVYANVNHQVLGNISTHSIHEIIYKEVEEGKSWFHIRNQTPCNNCLYQWLCPSPSEYEMAIGRLNLCHIKQ
jgi:pseudo-rSAM protein